MQGRGTKERELGNACRHRKLVGLLLRGDGMGDGMGDVLAPAQHGSSPRPCLAN